MKLEIAKEKRFFWMPERRFFKVAPSILVFLLNLIALFLAYQVPFTYTLNLGQENDDWAVRSGFGDREQNNNFSFRWMVQAEAKLFIPDIGWPSRIGLVGVAPRPDNKAPLVTLTTDHSDSFAFGPGAASLPPAQYGRLTFMLAGPKPNFQLNPNSFLIKSELFQPANDPRALGIVINQVYIQSQPSRFGLIIPPLAQWLGWAIGLTLFYLCLLKAFDKLAYRGRSRRPGYFAAFGITNFCLLLVMLARWLSPEWIMMNGAGIAWGFLLPWLGWLLPGKWRSIGLVSQLAIGVGLVYYQMALPIFPATQFIICGALLLLLVIRHQFAYHLEQVGLLICLTAPLGWLLWQSKLPRAVDLITYHLPWINELDNLIRQGNFYPRWTPTFVWQQGWAIFNFYPPSSRYLPVLGHFSGLNFNNAVLLSEYLALVAGVAGCYFWCQEILQDRRAALLGALAFCYLPYRMIDLFSSGMLSNFMGSAFLPWITWLLTRLIRGPQKTKNAILLGLLSAGLILTSTPQLIVYLMVIWIYTLGLIIIEGLAGNLKWRQAGLNLGLAGLIAFGLSAFYLLPATFEINQVGLKFGRAGTEDASSLWVNTYSLFDLWYPLEWGGGVHFRLGTLSLWLTLIGMLIWLTQRARLRPYLLVLGLTAALSIFLQFPASRFIWQTFPQLTSVQFASRLNYTVITFAAPLIGGLAVYLKSRLWQLTTALTGLVALGLMLYSCFYSLDTPFWPVSFDGTISQKSLVEQIGNADVMYLPKGAVLDEILKFQAPRFADNRVTSPANQLSWEITGTDSYRLRAVASQSGDVSVPIFWFEDWWLVEDEQGIIYPTSPARTTGHLEFELPAGQHQFTIKLKSSPIQQAGNLISLIALLGLFGYISLQLKPNKKRLEVGR